MYSAKIIADSTTPHSRITTFVVTFPRFLLAEFNTHRMLSKNSASSRAIPPEKVIENILLNPFVPTFNTRVNGMGVGEYLCGIDQLDAQREWRNGMLASVRLAQRLLKLNVDKSRVNRVLEPYMWHTAIVTGTNWKNFFALRCPDDQPTKDFPAQIEFQTIAVLMRDAYLESEPVMLQPGQWHTPFVKNSALSSNSKCMISAGICARVSYNTHGNEESSVESFQRALNLLNNNHLSPFEHQAQAQESPEMSANFYGFTQYRTLLPNEKDASVKRPELAWLYLIN